MVLENIGKQYWLPKHWNNKQTFWAWMMKACVYDKHYWLATNIETANKHVEPWWSRFVSMIFITYTYICDMLPLYIAVSYWYNLCYSTLGNLLIWDTWYIYDTVNIGITPLIAQVGTCVHDFHNNTLLSRNGNAHA